MLLIVQHLRLNMSINAKQVECAIQIAIEKQDPKRQRPVTWLPNSDVICSIGKVSRARFCIVKSRLFIAKITDNDCSAASIIDIRCVNPHTAPRFPCLTESDPHHHGFVGKCAITVIAIQKIGRSIVRHREVNPSVMVVIQKGYTE